MPEQTVHLPDVRKSVVVPATAEHCFAVFTERATEWWPPTHILVKQPRVALVFEPRAGGLYYERDVAGNEIAWGRILTWEPPHRLRMTWRIDGHWQSITDDERASEIEVDFTALDARTTRVELAHVKLDRHGDGAESIYHALAGPDPGETLGRFAAVV